MILYIYGDNPFGINRQLSAIKDKYLQKVGDNGDFSKYDLSQGNMESFLSDLVTVPMFSSSRLVFAENATQSGLTGERIDQLSDMLPDSTNLVFIDFAVDKRTAIFKKLSKLSGAKEFKKPSPESLPGWVQEQTKRAGAEIDLSTARFLVDYVGADQWLLYNELQKLAMAGKAITKDLIGQLSSPSLDATAFQLAEALVKKDTQKALGIYDELKLQGSADQQIQGAIIYQYRTLLLASLNESDLIAAYKMSPYPMQKARALLRGIDLEDIRKAYSAIAKADLAIKTGEQGSTEAMRGLIYSLSS